MIASKDRSGYFGASDTGYIIGNTNTQSFEKWWLTKIGIAKNNYESVPMLAGTHIEHRILDSLGFPIETDKQIIIEPLKLRVNLDGNTDDTIYEVKTYKLSNGFNMPLKYKQQVWVQMYASNLRIAYIVAYGLTDDDYDNFYLPIDKTRLSIHQVSYNDDFISRLYYPRLSYFCDCMARGVMPQIAA